MDTRRKVAVGIVAIVIIIISTFLLGFLSPFNSGVENIGEWGEVSDESIEVITTVWVDNPNPFGFELGDSVTVNYDLYLNEINLGSGETDRLDLPAGNHTAEVSTQIQNEKIAPWWVAFIEDNETLSVHADPSARIGGTVSTTVDMQPHEETRFQDTTPVINSLSQVASGLEGEYPEYGPVSYEIQEGWAEWDEVTEETTVVNFHFNIHNPNNIHIPAEAKSLGIDVEMNDVEIFSASPEDPSLRNLEDFDETVIGPGETKEVVYAVEMDNTKIDDWFRSHVEQGEQTDIRTELRLIFELDETRVRIPGNTPVAYTCELQTSIFIDNQETNTDCGEIESLDIVDESDETDKDETAESNGSENDNGNDESPSTPTQTETPTPQTPTPTPEPEQPPNADAEASPEKGEAPLRVEFDGSGSSDPDGTIVEYTWEIEGPTPGGKRATITRRFQTEGTYTATLTVVDNDGNEASDTVTIEVDQAQVEPPTAVAEANPTSGEAPLEIEFDARGSSDPDDDIESYLWGFRDGSDPVEGESVTHTFTTPGEYSVILVATDSEGNQDSARVTIVVEGEPSESMPTAVAEANPTSGEAPLEVEFDARGSSDPNNDIERYVWHFTDGNPPTEGESVTHTFTTSGEYNVILEVIDSQGNRDTDTVTITVDSRVG